MPELKWLRMGMLHFHVNIFETKWCVTYSNRTSLVRIFNPDTAVVHFFSLSCCIYQFISIGMAFAYKTAILQRSKGNNDI